MARSLPQTTLLVVTLLISIAAPDAAAEGPAGKRGPKLFLTASEAAQIKKGAGELPLLAQSLAERKESVEAALRRPLETPQPGEGGGPAHERHKQNYRDLMDAGMLFQITGDERYARFVRDLLELYAALYPTLPPHPLAEKQSPGKLFHQMLNESVWLVHVSIAYDCVHDWLPPDRRAHLEAKLFRPMAAWLSEHHVRDFNKIHNHGTWAVAAVGMLGYVIGDQGIVDRAIYGTERNRTGGFLRQLDLLFSPDGYYMEGPYYIRYALKPFYHFAEAIERNQPQIGIYRYRDQILKKALFATVRTAMPNGVFPPINDASRWMDVRAEEVLLATDLAYARYGADPALLGVAALQNRVILNDAGVRVARGLVAQRTPPQMSWPSLELRDGPDGERGGLGILRAGAGADQTMLLMKYGVHGGGHGHFDLLHFLFFHQGREVIPDYGYSRWINIEPKHGGRYLPENDSYASQTIAHNTVVVNGETQSRGKEAAAEEVSGTRHFFDASNPRVQVMSARADRAYDRVGMQRSMFLVQDKRLEQPVVVDLYRLTAKGSNKYDYPIHFRGQLITTPVKYEAFTKTRKALGSSAGYQHIWEEARARTEGEVRLTWLEGGRYYTFAAAGAPQTELVFGRTGAADPNFNLFSEPLFLLRRRATGDHLFAAAIQPHGFFDGARERSLNPRGDLEQVRVIGHSAEASVVEVKAGKGAVWTVMVTNGPSAPDARHKVSFGGQTYEWVGDYKVDGVE